MILRRLAAALRHQDWAAVTIELVIVVLGIFLGLQAADWNERRIAAAEERVILERLATDLAVVDRRLEQIILVNLGQLRRLALLVEAIDAGEVEPGDAADVGLAMLETPRQLPAPALPATLAELVASGRLWQLSDPELGALLHGYRDRHERVTRQATHFAATLRAQHTALDPPVTTRLPRSSELGEMIAFGAPDDEPSEAHFRAIITEPEVIGFDFEAVVEDPAYRRAFTLVYGNRRARLTWLIGLRLDVRRVRDRLAELGVEPGG